MFRIGSSLGRESALEASEDAEINMAPLIDMVFLLLIFFLVTASFVRESGVVVQRPEAATGEEKKAAGLFIGITENGEIFMDKNQVDLKSVRGMVEHFLVETPGRGVMIEADRQTATGRLVEVLDQCRMAGAEDVAVSTVRRGP
jgi:biopolymer transport protein ExbD